MMLAEASEHATTRAEEAVKVRLAASSGTPPALLRQLAQDPNVVVRAAVAINHAAGPEVERSLTRDADERVRALLAGRIAKLLPSLSSADRSSAASHVHALLLTLARDEAVRVRLAIAEVVKGMHGAPRELILQLANDPEFEVSEPIIRLSPVLTDSDLIILLATPPHPQTAVAVAGRQGLSPAVADAIAQHADSPAIRAMLANPSARIREATLDALVGRSVMHLEWHHPIVHRPALSARAVRALSVFVTGELLGVLVQRAGLDPAEAESLRGRLSVAIGAPNTGPENDQAIMAELERLRAAGRLDENVLLEAARLGNVRRVAAALAVAAGVSLSTVDRIVGFRSAKALIGLVWRAGFSMRAGMAVQSVLGQLGPGDTLAPGPDGGFPLSEEELKWQVELLREPARAATTEVSW
ncbi:MAG TPA: DUF2336 domain-containing protein [Acetobacteraceae bacterium]|nr:DUF2336 domain-containing protein [Acetobacteraceae bacterium]